MSWSIKLTLAAIALFILSMVGSFIWFVATWDASKEPSLVRDSAPAWFLWASNIPGSGAAPQFDISPMRGVPT